MLQPQLPSRNPELQLHLYCRNEKHHGQLQLLHPGITTLPILPTGHLTRVSYLRYRLYHRLKCNTYFLGPNINPFKLVSAHIIDVTWHYRLFVIYVYTLRYIRRINLAYKFNVCQADGLFLEKSTSLLIDVVRAGIISLAVIIIFPNICAPSTTGN